MSLLKKLFGQNRPINPAEPIFPRESFSIIQLNMPEGLAFATVNEAYKNYPNKSFYPYLVGIELEIIDKNGNGHPVTSEAVRLNEIEKNIETFLKERHTVHFVARVTRNGARDVLYYIDTPKLTEQQVAEFCDEINKERKINFGIQKDSTWNAVSGFIK
jgi:hypothetical protein